MNTKKIKTIAMWVLQVLLSALFVWQAVMKLSGMPAWVKHFRDWGYPEDFYLLIGAFEGLGALGLLIPKVSAYSASMLFVIMVSATVTHISHDEPAIATIVIEVLLGLIAYFRRPKFINRVMNKQT